MAAIMAQATTWRHASSVDLAFRLDVHSNNIFLYLSHQAATANLLPLDSSVLHEMSPEPRPMSSTEVTAFVQDLFLTKPLEEWNDEMKKVDPSTTSIELGACGILSTGFSLLFNGEDLAAIINAIKNLLR